MHLEAFVSRSLELISLRNSSRSLEYPSSFHTCSPTRDSEGQSKAAMKAAPDRGGLQMHRSVLGQCAESRQTRVGTNKQSHQRWVDAKKHSRTAEPVSPERCSFGHNYTPAQLNSSLRPAWAYMKDRLKHYE